MILKGDDKNEFHENIFMLVGLTFVWGLNVSLVKVLVEHFQPVTITSIRIFTAALTVFLVLSLSRRIRLPYKKEWIYIIGGSLTAVIFHHYFLSVGLSRTSATNADHFRNGTFAHSHPFNVLF